LLTYSKRKYISLTKTDGPILPNNSLDLQSLFNPSAGGNWLKRNQTIRWDTIASRHLQALIIQLLNFISWKSKVYVDKTKHSSPLQAATSFDRCDRFISRVYSLGWRYKRE